MAFNTQDYTHGTYSFDYLCQVFCPICHLNGIHGTKKNWILSIQWQEYHVQSCFNKLGVQSMLYTQVLNCTSVIHLYSVRAQKENLYVHIRVHVRVRVQCFHLPDLFLDWIPIQLLM